MSLEIKDYKVLMALMDNTYHPTLTKLVAWCSVRHSKFMITSAFRKNDSGVHGTIPCRGTDLRTWHFRGKGVTDEEFYKLMKMLENDTNKFWVYDPKRPTMKCAKYKSDAKKGPHIHLKVHDRTIYHEKGETK